MAKLFCFLYNQSNFEEKEYLYEKQKLVTSFLIAASLIGIMSAKEVDAKARFRSCNEAWAAGYGNMRQGEEGYSSALDRDHDGVACEINGPSVNTNTSGHSATTTEGWQQSNGYWYYYVNGSPVTGWYQVGGTWYYFASDGIMQTGWKLISGYWYYFDGSGAMNTNWQSINGTWYYFENSGEMKIGWKAINGLWYYFDTSGSMNASRWQGNYYLGSDGAMLTNTTTPDGYRVDNNGLWVQETAPTTVVPLTTDTTSTTH